MLLPGASTRPLPQSLRLGHNQAQHACQSSRTLPTSAIAASNRHGRASHRGVNTQRAALRAPQSRLSASPWKGRHVCKAGKGDNTQQTQAKEQGNQDGGAAENGAASNGSAGSNGQHVLARNAATVLEPSNSSNGAESNGSNGKGGKKAPTEGLMNILRKKEQTDFVAAQDAAVVLGGIPSDNTPNPASSWLPHTDQPTPVQPRGSKVDTAQRIKNAREKLCAIPEFIKSQAAYRVQQLMLSNTVVKLVAVLLFATPAVVIGGELYSLLQPGTTLSEGLLKIYSVLYIIPGVNVLEETNAFSFLLVNIIFLIGTFTFAVVLGVVSDDITTEVKAIRSGNYPVLTEGHILLLNWNRQTVPLLRQLAVTTKESNTNKIADIVVMAEREKDWMDAEMKDALKGYNLSWQSREGSPYSAGDLTRVSAGAAAKIVLLRPDTDEVVKEQHIATREVAAILGIHAQRDQVRKERHSRQALIVQAPEEGADVVTAAKRVLLSEMEALGLRDKRDMSMLIAQSALQPGVASVHCAILQKSPGSVSFFLREFPELAGMQFQAVRRKFADAVICGIFRTKKHFPLLNPGDDEIINDGDKVIALSNNSRFRPSSQKLLTAYQTALDNAQRSRNKADSNPASSNGTHSTSSSSSSNGAHASSSNGSARSSNGSLDEPAGSGDAAERDSIPSENNGSGGKMRKADMPEPMPPRNIVIAGWCGSMNFLVDGMSAFAPPGSNVTIICECPPTGMPQGQLNGVNFGFLPGYPHNTSCLEEAGVRNADAIIIGPADDLSDKEADAQLLSMIMLIQDILLDDLKNGERSNGNKRTPTHVVGVVRCAPSVKVANYLVRDLAQNTMTAELLQPDELVSGLIAQVAAEPDLAIVLPLLIDSWEGTEARLREPEELGVADLRATPFAEVCERAASIGEVAIGFVTRAGSLVLAPNAGLEHVYRNTDRIVVFANAQHGATCRLQKFDQVPEF